MDIIIYAQALKINAPGDVYYKDRYIDKNRDEKLNLTDFLKNIEILNCSKEKDVGKVIAKNTFKYLYLDIPCIEKDDIGRYSPIIIQAYYKDVDKIFEALDEFLERSNRHITEESRKDIKEEIKKFRINRERREDKLKVFGFILFSLGIMYLLSKRK